MGKIKKKKIGFEDFLVGISVCFVDSMIEDAVRVMFDGVNVSNEAVICKQDVIDSYERSWNEEERKEYEIDDEELQSFCDLVFKAENEKIHFDTFYDRILSNEQQHVVHHFL